MRVEDESENESFVSVLFGLEKQSTKSNVHICVL